MKVREQFESVLKGKDSIIKNIDHLISQKRRQRLLLKEDYINSASLDVNKVQNEFEELQLKITDLNDIISSRMRRLEILITRTRRNARETWR